MLAMTYCIKAQSEYISRIRVVSCERSIGGEVNANRYSSLVDSRYCLSVLAWQQFKQNTISSCLGNDTRFIF